MKLSLLLSSLLICSFAPASSYCFGEAQIIGKVISVKRTDYGVCFAYINEESVKLYTPNATCPLPFEQFKYAGIKNKMLDGETQECEYMVGDEISGVVVRSRDEYVTLEQ